MYKPKADISEDDIIWKCINRMHLYLLNLTVKLFLSRNGITSHQSEKACITAINIPNNKTEKSDAKI